MTSLLSLTAALNDDCIRVIMLCLAVPDVSSFSSTCATIHKLLDQTTLTALVKASLPPALATSFFGGTILSLDVMDVYRDFALMVTTMPARAVPNLSDFKFCVRCTQSGVTLPWFSCEAEKTFPLKAESCSGYLTMPVSSVLYPVGQKMY